MFFIRANRNSQTIHTAYYTIDSINKHVVDSLKLESRLSELSLLIDRISGQEMTMRDLAENHDKVERITIQRFAEWTISPETTAVPAMLEQVHTIIAGSANLDYIGQKSLLLQLATYLQVSRSQSGQQNLNSVYYYESSSEPVVESRSCQLVLTSRQVPGIECIKHM